MFGFFFTNKISMLFVSLDRMQAGDVSRWSVE